MTISNFTRPECETQVKGFAGAIYKKFKTSDEATQFIAQKRTNATLSTITGPTAATLVSQWKTIFSKPSPNARMIFHKLFSAYTNIHQATNRR